MKRTFKTLTAASVVAGVVYFGVFNVGADDPHSQSVQPKSHTHADGKEHTHAQ